MKYQKLRIKKVNKNQEKNLKQFLKHHDNIYHTNLYSIYLDCFERKNTLQEIAQSFYLSVPSLRRNIAEVNLIVDYFNNI